MKTRVLILYNKLFHYRVPIFNILAKRYDLEVVYSYPAKESVIAQCEFKTRYIPMKKKMGMFFHEQSVKDLCKDVDVVIAYGQISYMDYSLLALARRKFKLLFWSIGAPASYSRRYGEGSRLYYMLGDFFHKRADGLIFYSDKGKEMHINRGFDKNRLFVANNTVKVEKIQLDPSLKKNLLFIGTLYLEKGLQSLLDSYKKAYKENNAIPDLLIIGGGAQYSSVKEWVVNNDLEQKIKLLGPIYDTVEKAKIFQTALACVSPNQAGLSVLESMGYGVPFVTSVNAITGGESFNIQNGRNGILFDDSMSLSDLILNVAEEPGKYIAMGENAYSYYWKNRTPEIMAQGIADAIDYSVNIK